jgi:hypothetical protein
MRAAQDIAAQSLPGIVYASRPDTTPEAELTALTAIYTLVLSNSQAVRGGTHDLTNESTKKRTTGPDKKGKDNADIHGN